MTESEAMGVLRNGPKITWFEPWATRGTLFAAPAGFKGPYGYVHMRGGADDPEAKTFWDRSGLAWGLDNLYGHHDGCADCEGVFYFMPDEKIAMRMVVEEYPPVTNGEARRIARRQRQQERRQARFHRLLWRAAELVAARAEADS
ncbi:hypothetical protein [Clavibacter californiensis]|uniref:hypothetical protein n=1 Tax=Clavibacter californiensis TaxID=1401995 RepID=UPI0011C2158D|nr:hypothetical protein [Clavibacter californiensis]UKF78922.1 hypothetical protein FGD68_08870 [Clavibacter californiensis]